jgi:hypothetical protein
MPPDMNLFATPADPMEVTPEGCPMLRRFALALLAFAGLIASALFMTEK